MGPSEERLSFEDMADALVTDYEINKLRSLRSVYIAQATSAHPLNLRARCHRLRKQRSTTIPP
jgi:hypothetical protein